MADKTDPTTFLPEDSPIQLRLAAITDQIDALKAERGKIYRQSIKETDPALKVCSDGTAALLADTLAGFSIEYPITVHGIAFNQSEAMLPWKKTEYEPTQWVSVRPVAKQYDGKTFLGVYLGDAALGASARYSRETGILEIGPTHHNPMIYMPDLGEIVYGCGSWWGSIKSEDDLRKISDADIQNIWYVKALKSLEAS